MVWWILDGWQPQIAFSRTILAAAVQLDSWSASSLGLLPALGLLTRSLLDRRAGLPFQDTLSRTSVLVGMVTAARLLACVDVASGWLPWLTLIWTPHLNWALALAILWPARSGQPGSQTPSWHRPLAIGVITALLYGAYTVYACQLTMLHGDEGQYLRVTQSLLRDGDIDLSNNLDRAHSLEYHVAETAVDRAPASPDGKVHSIHPVGLSALLVPVYQWGLDLGNPRLVCALFIAGLTAACVALLDLWLRRLGIGAAAAGATTAICASSAPLLFFSTQLYPEIPALLISLCVLILLPSAGLLSRSQPSTEPPLSPTRMTVIVVLLLPLPFLHPRYLAVAGLLTLILAWEAWRTRTPPASMGIAAAVGGLGLFLFGVYNVHYSGDWLGAIRPGNAWEEGALQPATWLISLPGHWLHATKGLFINAPVFAATLPALLWMLRRRDPRVFIVVTLYLATAVTNGLHPMWWFGFGLPARFLVTALPAIALCLAVAIERIRGNMTALLLVCLACVIGWETILTSLPTPETAFEGRHLRLSSIMRFFPLPVFGVPTDASHLPLADALFWIVVIAATAGFLYWKRPQIRVAMLLILLVWPGVWGRGIDLAPRLRVQWVPFLNTLTADGGMGQTTIQSRLKRLTTAAPANSDGVHRAMAGKAGSLVSYSLSTQPPGLVGVLTDRVHASTTSRSRYLVKLRATLPAVAPWEERRFFPIHSDGAGLSRFYYLSERQSLGYLDILSSGEDGDLQLGTTTTQFQRASPARVSMQVDDFTPTDSHSRFITLGRRIVPGRYRATFDLGGTAWSDWFRREAEPIRMSVFLTDPDEDLRVSRERVIRWMKGDPSPTQLIGDYATAIPQVERLEATWWTCLSPLVDDPYQITFSVPRPSMAWVVYQYEGDADLRLHAIRLDEETFRTDFADPP